MARFALEMSIDPIGDEKIVQSWRKNAIPWTAAVRENQIESRALVTNRAIADRAAGGAPITAFLFSDR
jgi:hypothetical protein